MAFARLLSPSAPVGGGSARYFADRRCTISTLAEVFYDLKKFLEESKAAVPAQLATHEAAKNKPGTIGTGRPAVQFAKK